MIHIDAYVLLQEYQTNTWLVWDDVSQEAILVDPAGISLELDSKLDTLKLKLVLVTHGHGDHIGGCAHYSQKYDAPVAIHEQDAQRLIDSRKNLSEYMGTPISLPAADRLLREGEIILLGQYQGVVIHTPGHTPGSICFYIDKFLISGDTLFELSIGRTDFPGGSHQQIIDSIRSKLYSLPDEVVVFPGHGPRTSIGMEKLNNPFVR